MLRITPVYGSRYSPEGEAIEPQCTLVEYAGVKVLWNVGWWACDNGATMRKLPEHDVLIVTDSTLQSSGGLALYHQQYPETPVYATFPTVKMGQMTAYDQHAALTSDGKWPAYTLEDVDQAFARVICIKYSQSILIDANKQLSITAHRAGHVVGGAFYVLHRLQDETTVVLTSNYHIAKEIHLDSSTLLEHASTPDVLVTHPGGPAFRKLQSLAHGGGSGSGSHQQQQAAALPPILVTQAERNLVETILSVLRREGNVLLPVDAAGRVLELVVLLNRHWERQRLSQAYNLVWLSPMVVNTVEFARSQLEWMAGQLTQQFDDSSSASGGGHPYHLKYVYFCSTVRELELYLEENQNPTCVLATGLSLEGGPARDLLLQWADNDNNSIIFTDSSQCYLRRRSSPASPSAGGTTTTAIENAGASATMETQSSSVTGLVTEDGAAASAAGSTTVEMASAASAASSEWTTAAQLLSAWFQAKAQGREMEDSVTVDVNVPHRAPLAGAELAAFLASEEAKRREQLLRQEKLAMLREVEIAKGQLRLGEQDAGGGAISATVSTEASRGGSSGATSGAASRPKKKSRFDASLFLKFSKPLHLTFETREEAVGIGQEDSTAKFGIGESVGRSGEVLEDDYGIAVIPEKFIDIVSGVDPSKFAGTSGRIGEEVLRRGLGYGVDANPKSSSAARRATSKLASGSARISEDEDDGELDKADEQASEAIDLSEGSGIIRGRNGRPPIKVTTVTQTLEVLAEISYLPLEGRVDARAARQSVRALQPRRVVVLGGPNINGEASSSTKGLVDEVKLLADAAFSFATDKKPILTPSDGETAELDVGHAAYAVRIIDTPFMSREDKEAGKEPLAPMEPFEVKLGPCTVSLLDTVATGQKVALDGSIVLAPRQATDDDDIPRIYLSDGEVLLTDLRAELIASGMKAEYSAHAGYAQLVVNGKITIKKASDSGEIEVEGPLCKDFFTVRNLVSGQFVAV